MKLKVVFYSFNELFSVYLIFATEYERCYFSHYSLEGYLGTIIAGMIL